MALHTEQDRELARVAGFEVCPDSDQEGCWVWLLRDETGQLIEGCDSSFPSEEDAWEDVVLEVIGSAMADGGLSTRQWEAMSQEERLGFVRQSYGG